VTLLPADCQNIATAAELLRGGGLVAFPTETVYGLGALAFNPEAVAQIFELKQRPRFDPLIVHVLDRAMLELVVPLGLPPQAEELAARFWPGPLTLVLPKAPAVPEIVTAGLETVAVRMPSHSIARTLLAAVGAPLAAPSANRFGGLSPTRAEHIERDFGTALFILNEGRSRHGIESTVIALEPRPALLRPGAIPAEEIEAVIGPLGRERQAPVRAPGQFEQHYAPRTRLRVIEPGAVPASQRTGAGALSLCEEFAGYAVSWMLSRRGDLREAAAGFFETLHALDALGLERIDAQPFPEHGLGLAMMDRLTRAASKRNI
jgi:L-threonylcarbamoyladenylate synthase